SYLPRTVTTAPVFLGLEWQRVGTIVNGWKCLGWIRGAWMHEFLPGRTTESQFQSAPGFTFVLHGAEGAVDALRAAAGLDLQITRGFAIFGRINGDFSRFAPNYSTSLGLSIAW